MLDLEQALVPGTALVALFLALPLLALARLRRATLWLGLFVAAIGSLCLSESLQDYPALFGVFDWPVACLGAFYYCYVRSLTGVGNGRRQAWHFLPLALAIPALAWIRAVQLMPHPGALRTQWSAWLFGGVLFGSQGLAVGYVSASLVRIAQFRRRLRDAYSSTGRRDLAWLAWVSAATIMLLLVWVPATAIGGLALQALGVGRLALLFFLGWFGLRQAAVFLSPVIPAADAAAGPAADNAGVDAATGDARPKYSRSGMTDAARNLIGERLALRMESGRGYLDNDIPLADLAQQVGTSPQLLSQYLNDVLGQTFFDYVNGLRVGEVQRSMRSDDGRTLTALALAAGFNSKSTFNASFKKVTGLSPSAWRKLLAGTS